ncbi:hypothetical protein IE077_001797 [Cardiosporidium cionae]|uniref:Uncharacterized protein n=1 Tax=Cardiosporidium cionae TaxID=476202 RepID=A0ABQ7JC90_9APIC|nr:hypothetical protein IE077_001797 [Cardiosporidium cionae]|eukprot:KAF8821623.1 hypothetical protein IE077_001797 [Cardiosporidium cionae]
MSINCALSRASIHRTRHIRGGFNSFQRIVCYDPRLTLFDSNHQSGTKRFTSQQADQPKKYWDFPFMLEFCSASPQNESVRNASCSEEIACEINPTRNVTLISNTYTTCNGEVTKNTAHSSAFRDFEGLHAPKGYNKINEHVSGSGCVDVEKQSTKKRTTKASMRKIMAYVKALKTEGCSPSIDLIPFDNFSSIIPFVKQLQLPELTLLLNKMMMMELAYHPLFSCCIQFLLQRLHCCPDFVLVKVMNTLSRCGYSHHADWKQMMEAFIENSTPKLSGTDVADLLWGLTKVNIEVRPILLYCKELLKQRLDNDWSQKTGCTFSLSVRDVSLIVSAYMRQSLPDQELFLLLWESLNDHQKTKSIGEDILRIAEGFIAADLVAPLVLKELREIVLRNYRKFQLHHLIGTSHALMQGNALSPSLMYTLSVNLAFTGQKLLAYDLDRSAFSSEATAATFLTAGKDPWEETLWWCTFSSALYGDDRLMKKRSVDLTWMIEMIKTTMAVPQYPLKTFSAIQAADLLLQNLSFLRIRHPDCCEVISKLLQSDNDLHPANLEYPGNMDKRTGELKKWCSIWLSLAELQAFEFFPEKMLQEVQVFLLDGLPRLSLSSLLELLQAFLLKEICWPYDSPDLFEDPIKKVLLEISQRYLCREFDLLEIYVPLLQMATIILVGRQNLQHVYLDFSEHWQRKQQRFLDTHEKNFRNTLCNEEKCQGFLQREVQLYNFLRAVLMRPLLRHSITGCSQCHALPVLPNAESIKSSDQNWNRRWIGRLHCMTEKAKENYPLKWNKHMEILIGCNYLNENKIVSVVANSFIGPLRVDFAVFLNGGPHLAIDTAIPSQWYRRNLDQDATNKETSWFLLKKDLLLKLGYSLIVIK